ncbi:MAG: hypothetical protein IKX88_02040 [Thermoguttaceae bacterium]|nr:hypothetical protein [Thermoguttaceae bacterium]MBR5757361.1 hypothetical protein [Thermoguttaceae bacterium]
MAQIRSDNSYCESLQGSPCVRRAAVAPAFEFEARYFTRFAWYYYAKFTHACVKGARRR